MTSVCCHALLGGILDCCEQLHGACLFPCRWGSKGASFGVGPQLQFDCCHCHQSGIVPAAAVASVCHPMVGMSS
jgi:hypothetical protein